MPVLVTTQAQQVLNQLQWLWMVLLMARSDNSSFNARLSEQHEEQKAEVLALMRKEVLPHMIPSGRNWEDVCRYTAEDPSVENRSYTEQLEQMLGEFGVCRAVDLYHWYLRRILQLALERNPSQIRVWAPALGMKPAKAAALEPQLHSPDVLYELFRKNEGVWRTLVHEFLGVFLPEEVPIFVEVRNRLVHDLGEDREGKVARAINLDSRWKPKLVDGFLKVGVSDGLQAAETMISDIQIMDWHLATLYALPTKQFEKQNIRRVG